MTKNEFDKWLDNLTYKRNMIVLIKMKYSCENQYTYYTYTNELLMIDEYNTFYWDTDWYEGQQDVEFLGAIPVDDVCVPPFGSYNCDI